MVTPKSKPVSSVMMQLQEEEQAPPSWVTPRTCRLPSGNSRSNLGRENRHLGGAEMPAHRLATWAESSSQGAGWPASRALGYLVM